MDAIQTYWQHLMMNRHNPKQAVFDLLKHFIGELDDGIDLYFFHLFDQETLCPDFHIKNMNGTLAYVILITPQTNLLNASKDARVQHFLSITNNVLLTDGLVWVWLHEGKRSKVQLSDGHSPSKQQTRKLIDILERALCVDNIPIQELKLVSKKLADCSELLKPIILKHLSSNKTEMLWRGYIQFTELFGDDISIETTAKYMAQGFILSLFCVKTIQPSKAFTLEDTHAIIPKSLPLIKSYLTISQLINDKTLLWLCDEILLVLNHLDLTKQKLTMDDELVRFYTYFIEQLDSTSSHIPQALASFMIQSADSILKNTFENKTGIANRYKVNFVDISASSGSCMLELFKETLKNIPPFSPKFDLTIKKYLLEKVEGWTSEPLALILGQVRIYHYLQTQGFQVSLPSKILLHAKKSEL